MNFFRAVSQKLEKDPRPGAERPLLRKLDTAFAEAFGNPPAKNAFTVFFARFDRLEFFRFVPVALTAALIIALGGQLERSVPKPETPMVFAFSSEDIEASWLDGKGDRPEFYDEMEEWMLTATDEDWDLLLEKNG